MTGIVFFNHAAIEISSATGILYSRERYLLSDTVNARM